MKEIVIAKSLYGNQDSVNEYLTLEWLDTNGLGSYASSTILNCHTRRYHGLLVAPLSQPAGKFVLLSKVDDFLYLNNKDHSLTAHQYPGYLHTGGYPFFRSFQLDVCPTFHYRCEAIKLTKQILLLREQNTVLIRYALDPQQDLPKNAALNVRPFIACRDFHALTKCNADLNTQTDICHNGIQLAPYMGMPTLYFQTNAVFEFFAQADWYRNFEYAAEQQRGFDFQEDLFAPGVMKILFDRKREIIFACSTQEQTKDLAQLWQEEVEYRVGQAGAQRLPDKKVRERSAHPDLQNFKDLLKKSAQQFLIQKENKQPSVIAGYHWFLEWGRDAMISLPGLTLYADKPQQCMDVLNYFAAHERQGLIPNFIASDPANNAYNTVDASLWFCWAAQQYYLKTKDLTAIEQQVWNTLKNIFNHYRAGTLYAIKQGEDGLIYLNDNTVNLTWMDAMVNGVPVTPRSGAAVEVNALWYNALCFMYALAKKLRDPIATEIKPLIKQVKKSFRKIFWDKKLGYLKDFVNEKESSAAIRPNQIFAISLPYSPLTKRMAKKTLHVVTENLLTPYGLRTLAPQEKNYQACYQGDGAARDAAYHNGTVWPWLLGHFGAAVLKFYWRKKARALLQPCLAALHQHLVQQAGLGGISEIFDGDAPHQPNGCINQAWSVAELLRLIHLMEQKKIAPLS
jgi:predicted glycogen debranching enzyme